MMMAFTAIKIAKRPVKSDCTAMRITPVTVWVVWAIPSSSTKTRMHTTERALHKWG